MHKNKQFVGYFDILGYRERIKNKTLQGEFEIQKKLLDDINKFIKDSKEIIKCGVINFSDTYIIFSEDFSRIIRGSLLFMMFAAVRAVPYFPIRGAISFGDFLFDKENKIIIGSALRDAYLIEKEQDWMGCCLADSCYEQAEYHSLQALNFFLNKGVLVKYDVPLKENRLVSRYVINMESYPRIWGKYIREMPITNKGFIENIFLNKGKDDDALELDKKTLKKLKNTQEFFSYIEDIKYRFS